MTRLRISGWQRTDAQAERSANKSARASLSASTSGLFDDRTRLTRVIALVAVALIAGQLSMAMAADEAPKPKSPKVQAPAPSQSGGVQSSKASGADKVAKARTCAGDAPKIKKVSPDEGKTGDKITITGENFGGAGCVSGVSFGPGNAAKFTQVDSGTVTATVPAGKKGLTLLSVTNSTGEDSRAFLRK